MAGNANHQKGAATERMAVRYLREYWPEADRRLREGRVDDQGDIDGVPFTCIQVKYWKAKALQSWVTQTLRQRDASGHPLCALVVRIKYQAVEKWDVYMPARQILRDCPMDLMDESEAWTWLRLDFRAARALLDAEICRRLGARAIR